jgi:hypothetical protein
MSNPATTINDDMLRRICTSRTHRPSVPAALGTVSDPDRQQFLAALVTTAPGLGPFPCATHGAQRGAPHPPTT